MVTVRLALDEDLAGVAALAARLVRYHHDLDPLRFLLPANVEDGYRHYLRGELRSGDVVILVALKELPHASHVVGYAYARIEPRNWNDLLDRSGKIQDLFVLEEERGQGLGRRLLQETIRRLEDLGIPRIVLHTATQNVEAQTLFASEGFRTTMLEMTRENTRPARRSVPPAG